MGTGVAVIGSGVAGLAAAIRSAAKGHAVTVFEANGHTGGKIAELRRDGFRWDMGPSVLTMPQYVDELFRLAGEEPTDHFRHVPLDPVFRYFFVDGTVISTPADREELIREFTTRTSVRRQDLEQYFSECREKLEITDPVFLQRSLHRWRNYLDRATLHGVLRFHRIGAFSSMARANAALLRDPKVTAIFNQYASYNGSDPFQAPATLNLIAHYELGLGASYPVGGMHSVTTSLTALAQRMGVRFRLNTRVDEIVCQHGRVQGVRCGKATEPFDRIFANADVHSVYSHLMPRVARPSISLRQPLSSSVIVFYWGIKGQFARLGLHNMFMSSDQVLEYHQIFKEGKVAHDPTIYLYISSTMNPTDAPAGHQNWFVMVTVPHHTGKDWDAEVHSLRQRVLHRLSQRLGADIGGNIVCEEVLTPPLIAQRTSSAKGAVYGNSSNGLFAAFLRHPNFAPRVKGLYLCGGSVHPGPSIPLSLLSAKIAVGLADG
jgi:phytoene desaturase